MRRPTYERFVALLTMSACMCCVLTYMHVWIGNLERHLKNGDTSTGFISTLKSRTLLGEKSVIPVSEATEEKKQENQEDDFDEDDSIFNAEVKADVEDVISYPWQPNQTAAVVKRREMLSYFNLFKVLTMTSDDVTSGHLARFYSAKSKTIITVPGGMHNLLPRRQLFRKKHYKQCSLVGNSGVLLQSGCGRTIDQSDFVIRCNFATIKGYEADVGSKVDVVTFNPSILNNKYNSLSLEKDKTKFKRDLIEYGKYVLWVPVFSDHAVSSTIRTLIDFLGKNKGDLTNVQLAFPGNVLPAIEDFWYSKSIDEERISTGLLMYMISSLLCEEVHLFGFYPFPEFRGKQIPYHYDHSMNRTAENYDFGYMKVHRLPDEFAYLTKLHKEGAINLHLESCTS
ncbi:sia-alpha-2,3-Gal-beta-1,4-GlcNAc-R:alpha 2,8-sialyltransferase-like [Anneissia japonica]|uniref:sia-alpha-2,3-Gal-beta-1,4-GlcNAc-R:alpha 2,8-sialyltransferase-like n=1 Tax=Anneissia japonica TaxID=1529436 RepID=UPI0014257B7B|nr:sia-alpha-2,3-Gal-beta-1,4-GlcNAc-R:alpha 2,8-sialyltransferase-like [Anneissia japonica]